MRTIRQDCPYFRISREKTRLHPRCRCLPIAILFLEIWTTLSGEPTKDSCYEALRNMSCSQTCRALHTQTWLNRVVPISKINIAMKTWRQRGCNVAFCSKLGNRDTAAKWSENGSEGPTSVKRVPKLPPGKMGSRHRPLVDISYTERGKISK